MMRVSEQRLIGRTRAHSVRRLQEPNRNTLDGGFPPASYYATQRKSIKKRHAPAREQKLGISDALLTQLPRDPAAALPRWWHHAWDSLPKGHN